MKLDTVLTYGEKLVDKLMKKRLFYHHVSCGMVINKGKEQMRRDWGVKS